MSKARFSSAGLLAAVFVLLLASCKVERPSDVLSPKKMETVLYDYHLAQVMCNDLNGQDRYKRELYMNYVYEKHHVTRAQVDSSLVWYARYPKDLSAIYEHLDKRVDAEIARLNEKRAEAKRYEPKPVEGDTADVWYERHLVLLSTSVLNNILTFTIPADSNFHARDNFEWTFNVIFVPSNTLLYDTLSTIQADTLMLAAADSLCEEGVELPADTLIAQTSDSCHLSKDSVQYVSRFRSRLVASLRIKYTNDSIIGVDTLLYDNGHILLSLQNKDSVAIREVYGSLWYKSEDAEDQIITSSHHLTRYRWKKPFVPSNDSIPCDSLLTDSLKEEVPYDSLATDSLKEEE
ncbi:MAG: DUF4296 domain-containing protein [Bacteroidaceae bacterium]|nr:DUF4296 domain-containing protein [Bacteroidaceae bacterium]